MTDFSAIEAGEMQELWLGPGINFSVFADAQEVKEAWERHRPVLMMLYAELGRRPWGWWAFDCPPGLRYDDDHEQSILWAAGILGADERSALEAHWRAEFEQGRALDAKARRKLYRDADIPQSLIKAWTAERKRRGKAIKQLPTKARKPAQQEAAPAAAQEDAVRGR
jgi:hypothetical protein